MTGDGHRLDRIVVEGGELAVGSWGPVDGRPVVAVHGIGSTHLSWTWLAEALTAADSGESSGRPHRLIAPDLRGRGRSAELPGPWGLRRHAEDVRQLIERVGAGRVVLVGHSMGAFVAVLAAAADPQRIGRLVLVDGGLPLALPAGMDVATATKLSLGPALARLSMTFTDREAYRAFWRRHPAFRGRWEARLDAYVDYDLVEAAAGLRSGVSADAVGQDSGDLFVAAPMFEALDRLGRCGLPVRLVTAPRGLLDAEPGLYPRPQLREALARMPRIHWSEMRDVNHYTILMSDRAAELVPDLIDVP